jgi:CubicO group peptidase (beta-lactamase class C family)
MPKHTLRSFVALLVFVAAAEPGAAQPAEAAAARTNGHLADHPRVVEARHLLETWLASRIEYQDIPGLSAAIVHDQELIWSGGLGYADVASKTQASAQTIYSICSISKLFTAIAVMQQRDAGRVRLDDPVAKHLPWVTIEQKYPDAPPVRVEGLLTHSSGLPRESDFPYWSAPDFRFPSRDEIKKRVAEQQTLYPSERWFQYSNLGLTLAGEVVSAVSGQAYDAYVRQHILEPLGLAATTPEIPATEKGKRLATGYGRRMQGAHRDVVPFYEVHGIAPAAGFASTAEDLARFASWQFRLLDKGGKEVLDANTLREMQRVHWVDPNWRATWGLGFSISRDGQDTFVGHGGSCPGYQTQLTLHPKDRVATIVMSNASGVDVSMLANRAYRIMGPALKRAAADTTARKPADASLEPYLGYYRGFWGDATVIRWEDGLAVVSLPTEDPVAAIERLRKTGDHTFARVRTEDESLGEEFAFEIGADGKATRFVRHSNAMTRIR